MKKKLFLFALLVLLSFRFLNAQTWINEEKDLTASSTNIEQFKNKGGTQTVYQSSTYAIGRKLNTDSSSFISRSYHQFNINQSVFPTNTQIDEVTVHYTTSAGSYSFKLTKVSAVGTDDDANWSAIGSGTSMDAGIAYSAFGNSFISTNIKTQMQNLLTSGKIILGALGENETANDSYADLFIWLHIKYRRPAQTFPYNAANYYNGAIIGGQIGVGLGQPPTSYPSPKQFDAIESQNINLLAYDNQDISIRRYLYNDTEAPNQKSKWDQDVFNIITPLGEPQTISVVASSTNAAATFRAWLKQNCKIDQTHKTEFDGDISQQNTTYIVEQNTGDISTQSTRSINGKTYNFAGWSDDFSLGTTRSITPNDNQTYSALYKVSRKSNQTNAYSNPSQRKFIQTPDGVKHICYESMGKVWYELSTNSGSTWFLGNGGKPLSGVDAKNPSMSFYGNQIAIVWQEKSNNSFKIKIAVFWGSNYSSSLFSMVSDEDISLDYSYNATPVIAWGYNSKAVVVWSGFNDCVNPFGEISLRYAYGSVSYNGISWLSLCSIPGTDENSKNPTIITNYNDESTPTYFHLAWEQGINSSISNIDYCKVYSDQNNYLLSSTTEEVSLNSGYSKNYNPVINLRYVYYNNYVYVSWIGYRTTPSVEKRVLLRDKLSIWYNIRVIGDDVYCQSMNTGSAILSNQQVLGISWSEATTSLNKILRLPSFPETIKTLTVYGQDVQVNNSSSFDDMHTNSFMFTALPYNFALSANYNAVYKENSVNVFNGREGVVGKNGAQFFFALGDIFVNGRSIDFKPIPDSVNVNSIELMNYYFESKPFSVEANSNLTYGVQYGITDSILCVSAIDGKGEIAFKVELVDNQTGEVLGRFDDIKYSSENVSQYNNLGYQVNLNGIGSRTVKFRLIVNTSGSFEYSLSNRISDQSQLAKSNYQVKEINSNISKVTNYALFDNYPNPFNPSTTIKYQLPEAGFVTLRVYDILGNEVKSLVSEQKPAGTYEVSFDASSLSSGVYIYKIQAGNFINSKKMILLK